MLMPIKLLIPVLAAAVLAAGVASYVTYRVVLSDDVQEEDVLVLQEAEQDEESDPSVLDDEVDDAETMDEEPVDSEPEVSEADGSGLWTSYVNPTYGYTVAYPASWFMPPDACCPPPPAYVVINNLSDVFFDFTPHQLDPGVESVGIYCGTQAPLSEHGEVRHYIDYEGLDGEYFSLNGSEAVSFHSGTYYVSDDIHTCRITFDPSYQTSTDIVSTFTF